MRTKKLSESNDLLQACIDCKLDTFSHEDLFVFFTKINKTQINGFDNQKLTMFKDTFDKLLIKHNNENYIKFVYTETNGYFEVYKIHEIKIIDRFVFKLKKGC